MAGVTVNSTTKLSLLVPAPRVAGDGARTSRRPGLLLSAFMRAAALGVCPVRVNRFPCACTRCSQVSSGMSWVSTSMASSGSM